MHKRIDIPLLGLGTWQLLGEECVKTVMRALELGYKHIDTAHYYNNHKAVGKALKAFERQDLFLTSKFNVEQIDDSRIEKSVVKSCEIALKELKTDYLDLYLLHWPDSKRPCLEMVQACSLLQKEGKIRAFGVSNFTIHHLKDFLSAGVNPSVNQVEFHPYLYQKELLEFCQNRAIQLVAYRPFGKGELVKAPLFSKMGEKHKKTAAQVLLRFCVQKGVPVIPKARSKSHLQDNLNIFDFELTPDEMRTLEHLSFHKRFCDPEWEEFSY